MDINNVILNKICESGLSRIEQWMETKDIVCLSACRDAIKDVTKGINPEDYEKWKEIGDYKLTPTKNKERTTQLKAKLLALGYGVTEIDGSYIEGFGVNGTEVSETSFFVVNLREDKDFFNKTIELSEYFNQDSILIKPKGEMAYLYGTNCSGFPGYHIKTEGKNYHALPGRFMSRVKKAAFSFANDNNVIIRKNKEDMTKGDQNDYDHEFLFANDERPVFSKKKKSRITSENVCLSENCINKLNEHFDKTILDVRENYKGFQRQNLVSTANIITNNLREMKNNGK